MDDLDNLCQGCISLLEFIWIVTCGQLIHNESKTPDVTVVPILFIGYSFGAHVNKSPYEGVRKTMSFIQVLTDAEICNFDLSSRVEQNIFWFYVSVD